MNWIDMTPISIYRSFGPNMPPNFHSTNRAQNSPFRSMAGQSVPFRRICTTRFECLEQKFPERLGRRVQHLRNKIKMQLVRGSPRHGSVRIARARRQRGSCYLNLHPPPLFYIWTLLALFQRERRLNKPVFLNNHSCHLTERMTSEWRQMTRDDI